MHTDLLSVGKYKSQIITDEKIQMTADICDDICVHLVSFYLC